MEALAVSYPIPETQASVNFDLTHLSVTTSQIDQEMFAGFEFTPPSASMTAKGEQPSDVLLPTVSLSIPPSLFNDIMLPHTAVNENSHPRISNIVYETDGLFLGLMMANPILKASVVASTTLSVGSHIVPVSNLDPPIVLVFAKLHSTTENITCSFWNFQIEGEPIH